MATRVADGLPLKTIAAQLEISVQATSTYLTRAQRKLGQPSRWTMAALLRGPLPAFAAAVARWKIELSPGEIDLGEMLLNGLSNADIARAIGTSNKVAGRLIARLLRKLKLDSRWELLPSPPGVTNRGHRGSDLSHFTLAGCPLSGDAFCAGNNNPLLRPQVCQATCETTG